MIRLCVCTMAAFQNSLPALKIYNARDVSCRFSASCAHSTAHIDIQNWTADCSGRRARMEWDCCSASDTNQSGFSRQRRNVHTIICLSLHAVSLPPLLRSSSVCRWCTLNYMDIDLFALRALFAPSFFVFSLFSSTTEYIFSLKCKSFWILSNANKLMSINRHSPRQITLCSQFCSAVPWIISALL